MRRRTFIIGSVVSAGPSLSEQAVTLYTPSGYSVPAFAGPHQGISGGGTRRFVACSNAYASAINFGSLHDAPVNPTPNGPGFASNPGGSDGVGEFGTRAKGTTMIG